MTMSLEELSDHAENLRGHLEHKRHQLAREDVSPRVRAVLERQIDALSERVDRLMWQCEKLRGDAAAPILQMPGVVPGVGPLPEAVA
jgi:hypothetical protein